MTDPLVLLKSANDTARPYPSSSVPELFAAQVALGPDRPAVVSAAETLTYRDLDERTARLAAHLVDRGVRAGDLVAVRLGRGVDWVVANLAVLRAGAAYLPLNPAEPARRQETLLADSGAVLVLDSVDGTGTGALPVIAATDPAYVMYTSGSTGTPKGVLVSHRNIVRLVTADFVDFTDVRLLQTGAVSFDATTFELWGPLLNGGTVVLPDGDVLDAERLGAQLKSFGITTMWLTSPLFSRLATRDATIFAGLRDLVVGGDVVVGEHVALVRQACPGIRIINGYGPTENTTFSLTHVITAEDTAGAVPIGRPLRNSTAYVLDAGGNPVAAGETGELYVGGDGVAIGYLRRPELTAAAFLDDPFVPGSRMYRTGDLARWREDGVVEFLGRADHQVKVRGFRIELGEVEAALRSCDDVEDAVVVVRERDNDVRGDRYLVGYVTSTGFLDPIAVRRQLATDLPAQLVPGHVIEVDAFPLTAHGKVDRAALPDPATLFDLPAEFVPPRTATEERLAAIWQTVLGLPAVGVLDSLFDLGVDSLAAAQLAVRTRDEFRCTISTGDVLANPTIEEIAGLVGDQPGTDIPVAAGTEHPLTPAQRPLFVEQSKDPRSVRYNVPILLDVAGVDPARLERALRALVARHSALRTSFVLAEPPVQRVAELADVTLELRDDEPDLTTLVRPFDLAAAPLLRASLHRGRWFFADFHHLVLDGYSLATVFRELDALYHDEELPPVAHQYADFAQWTWQAGAEVREADLAHWRQVFATAVPPLQLPSDRRPAVRTYAGTTIEVHFGPDRTEALRKLAARAGTTLFAPLFAAYSTFLASITGADDLVVGVPASGRTTAGFEDTVGMFVNTVGLRVRPQGTFEQFTTEVARIAAESFAHQNVPAGEQVIDTMFALQGTSLLEVDFLGTRVALRPVFPGQTMFDLNLQMYEEAGDLRAEWEYSTELFDRATAVEFRDLLLATVDRMLADPLGPVTETRAARGAQAPELDFDL